MGKLLFVVMFLLDTAICQSV